MAGDIRGYAALVIGVGASSKDYIDTIKTEPVGTRPIVVAPDNGCNHCATLSVVNILLTCNNAALEKYFLKRIHSRRPILDPDLVPSGDDDEAISSSLESQRKAHAEIVAEIKDMNLRKAIGLQKLTYAYLDQLRALLAGTPKPQYNSSDFFGLIESYRDLWITIQQSLYEDNTPQRKAMLTYLPKLLKKKKDAPRKLIVEFFRAFVTSEDIGQFTSTLCAIVLEDPMNKEEPYWYGGSPVDPEKNRQLAGLHSKRKQIMESDDPDQLIDEFLGLVQKGDYDNLFYELVKGYMASIRRGMTFKKYVWGEPQTSNELTMPEFTIRAFLGFLCDWDYEIFRGLVWSEVLPTNIPENESYILVNDPRGGDFLFNRGVQYETLSERLLAPKTPPPILALIIQAAGHEDNADKVYKRLKTFLNLIPPTITTKVEGVKYTLSGVVFNAPGRFHYLALVLGRDTDDTSRRVWNKVNTSPRKVKMLISEDENLKKVARSFKNHTPIMLIYSLEPDPEGH